MAENISLARALAREVQGAGGTADQGEEVQAGGEELGCCLSTAQWRGEGGELPGALLRFE